MSKLTKLSYRNVRARMVEHVRYERETRARFYKEPVNRGRIRLLWQNEDGTEVAPKPADPNAKKRTGPELCKRLKERMASEANKARDEVALDSQWNMLEVCVHAGVLGIDPAEKKMIRHIALLRQRCDVIGIERMPVSANALSR